MLELRQLSVAMGGVRLVGPIDLSVAPGEVLGLVGESGSGKSLTLRAMLRLLPPHGTLTGQALWNGADLLRLDPAALRRVRGGEIGMVFQEPMTALNPVLPVGRQITESLATHLGLRGSAARRRAVELLGQVGIPDPSRRLGSYPHEFSGGMRQRAMIAIALAAGPKLLLADEPTTALDVTIQDQILRLLLRLRDEMGLAVILVTHDLGVVAETCDRVAVMYAGRVVETGPLRSLFSRPSHGYTLGLLRSLPDPRHARTALPGIDGVPPDPAARLPGCRFAPRCRFADAACSEAEPALRSLEPVHASACIHAQRVREAA